MMGNAQATLPFFNFSLCACLHSLGPSNFPYFIVDHQVLLHLSFFTTLYSFFFLGCGFFVFLNSTIQAYCDHKNTDTVEKTRSRNQEQRQKTKEEYKIYNIQQCAYVHQSEVHYNILRITSIIFIYTPLHKPMVHLQNYHYTLHW